MSKRVLLLASPRTGSNLLVDALDQHPRGRMYRELFNFNLEERQAQQIVGRWHRDGEDGAAFVRDVVFAQSGFEFIGFKIFYTHADPKKDPNSGRVWDELSGDPSLKVIHLVRKNRLEWLISLELALKTHRWHVRAGEPLPPPSEPFVLDPGRAQRQFAAVQRQEARARERFAAHPVLDLEYERDLVGDFEGTMERVFRFLEVASAPFEKSHLKQARLTPREQLSNYDELRRHFENTEWARYFDESHPTHVKAE